MVILAMRDMNVARLTAKDVPLFDGIMQDIFPEVEVPTLDYDMLETAISAEMKIVGLQPVRAALLKVIQAYETKVRFKLNFISIFDFYFNSSFNDKDPSPWLYLPLRYVSRLLYGFLNCLCIPYRSYRAEVEVIMSST